MIASYDFCCSRSGCKATVHVTMHMHDDHQWDLEQLGRALGFHRVDLSGTLQVNTWQCVSHEAETPIAEGARG